MLTSVTAAETVNGTSAITRTSPKPVKTYVQVIDKETAQLYLSYADPNGRRIQQKTVERIANDIREGRWIFNGDTIRFDRNGVLVDGHHRLNAIILADTPVEALVVENLDERARTYIDGCRPRSTADVLKMTGYTEVDNRHSATLTAMLNKGWSAVAAKYKRSNGSMITEYAKYRDAVIFAVEHLPNARQQVCGVVARAYHTVNHDVLRKFCEGVRTGFGTSGFLPEENAPVRLREYLIKNKGSNNYKDLYSKTESALVAFIERRPVVQLQAVKKEMFPLPSES